MQTVLPHRYRAGRRMCITWARALTISILLFAAGCSSVNSREPSPGTSTASAGAGDDVRRLLARKGRSQFLHCNSCHVVDSAAPPPFGDSLGPHLEGIVGRAAASVEGFDYTDEVEGLDLVWDEATLDQWLKEPLAIAPAMCEPFTGMANPEHRRVLIAYLKNPGTR